MRPAAAEFVKQVVPAADLRFFDASHFALDDNVDAIAEAIIETFAEFVESRDSLQEMASKVQHAAQPRRSTTIVHDDSLANQRRER